MRALIPLTAALALSGCAFVSQQDIADQKALLGVDDTGGGDDTGGDCDNPLTGFADADGDGFGAGAEVSYCEGEDGFAETATDCDDADETAFPDGEEACDGVDNDCNGTVDDEPTDGITLYVDDDGDGFGDSTSASITGCAGTEGYADNDTDCNDSRDDINPDADETCNGVDDNCNTTIDDDATDATTWHQDADGDGFGSDTTVQTACEPPSGFWVENGGDCDDSELEVNPSAQELCDTVDNDCDDQVDENVPTWFIDDDLDGFGSTDLTQEGCDKPGDNWASNDRDCDDDNADVKPGAPEVCNTIDDDCDTKIDDDDLNLTGEPSWYADSDSDTYGDSADVLSQCAQPAGYVDNADDCDDAVGTVNPGATEQCNGNDDDCNGSPDNGLPFHDYYLDSDGDGYGDENDTSPVNACEAQSGRVADNTDCDDSTDTVSPDDAEICNGVDDDCAGGVDDGLSTANYWPDVDDDGYGDEDATPVNDCAQPPDTVTNGDDCDDTDEDISPGDAEVCNGVDDDCAGGIDDGLSTADYWPDVDDDGYGDEDATPVNDCAQPADTVTNGDDCEDGEPDINPGEDEICGDAIDQNCSGDNSEGCFPYDPYNIDPDDYTPGGDVDFTGCINGSFYYTFISDDSYSYTTPWQTCLGAATPTPVSVELDTDYDAWVIAVDSWTQPSGQNVRFRGERPVIVLVYGDVSIGGQLSAHSTSASAGAGGGTGPDCTASHIGEEGDNDTASSGGGGGGGGGGGAYEGGGNGGDGDSGNGGDGGSGGSALAFNMVEPLHGGCDGGAGGSRNASGSGGGGGPGYGGGALQFVIEGTGTISGDVWVGGGGGNSSLNSGDYGGGGGGGGGVLVLQADDLIVSGNVGANGGGGGAAASNADGDGADGEQTSRPAGGTGNSGGGDGGGGGTDSQSAGNGEQGDGSDGGGAGAGGVGRVCLTGENSLSITGTVEPANNCP